MEPGWIPKPETVVIEAGFDPYREGYEVLISSLTNGCPGFKRSYLKRGVYVDYQFWELHSHSMEAVSLFVHWLQEFELPEYSPENPEHWKALLALEGGNTPIRVLLGAWLLFDEMQMTIAQNETMRRMCQIVHEERQTPTMNQEDHSRVMRAIERLGGDSVRGKILDQFIHDAVKINLSCANMDNAEEVLLTQFYDLRDDVRFMQRVAEGVVLPLGVTGPKNSLEAVVDNAKDAWIAAGKTWLLLPEEPRI